MEQRTIESRGRERIHDGTITLLSKTTGRHRTFRVETRRGKQDPMFGKTTIGILAGPSNTDDFDDFGFVNNDSGATPCVVLWKRHCSRSDRGRSFFLGRSYNHAIREVERTRDDGVDVTDHEKYCALLMDALSPRPSEWAIANYEVKESRVCRRCGRELTTPQSIDDGIGPECAEKERTNA